MPECLAVTSDGDGVRAAIAFLVYGRCGLLVSL